MPFDRNKPYNDLPDLPPHADLETKPVLRACISAYRALAELKAAGEWIPDQGMLINAIPLQEAKASSEIENIVTTQDELFKAELNEGVDANPNAKEVLRYRTALWKGFNSLRDKPMGINLFRSVCGTILDNEADVRKISGTVIKNTSTHEVFYTPPLGEQVILDKLSALERYVHADDEVDPLIRLALIHYQFEAIHPFHDGNGRTGRIVNILYLVEKRLLSIPVLYLSRHIIEHKADYYLRLREVTEEGHWEPWVLFMLQAVRETASGTTEKIRRIRESFEKTTGICRAQMPGAYSRELVELLYRQPYCRIDVLVKNGIASRQTASKYLRRLEELNVLKGHKHGREIIYLNRELLEILTQ